MTQNHHSEIRYLMQHQHEITDFVYIDFSLLMVTNHITKS